jgi:predicted Zn-dependent protease
LTAAARFACEPRLAVVLSLVVLTAGCATQAVTTAPIEDRSPGAPASAVTAPAPVERPMAPAEVLSEPTITPAPPFRPPEPTPLEAESRPSSTGSGTGSGTGTAPEPSGNTAVLALLDEAEARASPAASAASLERALRIEPGNPLIWHRLARLRLDQGSYSQAEALALKSNTLATRRPDLWAENWAIVAEARRQMGDVDGAGEAEARRLAGAR